MTASAPKILNKSANRPINLNLFTIKFPIMAIVSICHRITGFVLFLMMPVAIGLFQYSLTYTGFTDIQDWRSALWVKILIWLFLAPLIFHLVAGIRHLMMDLHIGDSLAAGRMGARLTFAISIVLILLTGIWLW